MKWYLIPWKKYFEFKGRARRKEFWTFMLINMGIGYIITTFFPPSITSSGAFHRSAVDWIFTSITFLPSIAVTVRRLHDTNRNGGLVWLLLIPIVGWIIIIVWMCLDSNLGENDYGPDPKAIISTNQPTEEGEIWVYVTNKGNKYHKSSCIYLDESKIPVSLKEAKEKGYTPCIKCHPVE